MKNLKINDAVTLQYDVKIYYQGEYAAGQYTEFYLGTRTEEYKKYVLFGPKLKREVPISLFTLGYNIESNSITKERVSEDIHKAYNNYVALKERAAEIERGEII